MSSKLKKYVKNISFKDVNVNNVITSLITPLWMDVTLWCYKWVGGWDGMGLMDLRVG